MNNIPSELPPNPSNEPVYTIEGVGMSAGIIPIVIVILFIILTIGCTMPTKSRDLLSTTKTPNGNIYVYEGANGSIYVLYFDRDGVLVRRETIP